MVSSLIFASTAGHAQQPPANAPVSAAEAGPQCCTEARAALARRDTSTARRLLDQSIASGHTSPDTYYLLAYVLLRQNLPKESLAEYTAAAKLRLPSAEDLRNVALDYVLLNDNLDAEKWAERSLDMKPDDPETWYDLGRIHYTSGNLEAALDCFQHSLKLAPNSVKVEDNLGLVLEGLNRPQEAIAAYQKAIAIQQGTVTQSEQPLLNLGTLLIHRSELDQALPLLLQAVAIAPEDPKIHEQLGKLYFRQEKLEPARSELEAAISLMPNDPPLHFLLGQICHRAGLDQEAQREFATAAHLNGTHSTDGK